MKKRLPLSLRRKSFDEDFKKPPPHSPSGTIGRDLGFWMTAFLGFQTLGSIYGMNTGNNSDDKGISEQVRFTYTLGLSLCLVAHIRIFPNSTGPPVEDVLGAASCIVWSLTLVPLLKYSWLVLRAGDDQGEGSSHPHPFLQKAGLLFYICC